MTSGSKPLETRVDRLRSILKIVDDNVIVGVEEVAAMLAVSTATIRRDFAHLASQGLIARSHGRASRTDASLEVPFSHRRATRVIEKQRIAAVAASMVGEGAVVGVTGGTTTMAVARAIAPLPNLTVVTNALNVGMELARHRNIRLVLTGGVCRAASFELSGPIAENTLAGYHLDLAFVGVDGIDVEAGLTTHQETEALANAALVKRASRTIVVADSSKIGHIAFVEICPLNFADLLITDDQADSRSIAQLEEAGLQVVLA